MKQVWGNYFNFHYRDDAVRGRPTTVNSNGFFLPGKQPGLSCLPGLHMPRLCSNMFIYVVSHVEVTP